MKSNTSMEVSTVFAGDFRVTASGTQGGRRMSFVQDAPAGDIRKALKARGFKGKELTVQVDKVLRGDSTLGWACFEASVSAARSKGFIPTVGDLNKKGNRLTMKLERPSMEIDKEAVKQIAVQEFSVAELQALVEEAKEKQANKDAIALKQ